MQAATATATATAPSAILGAVRVRRSTIRTPFARRGRAYGAAAVETGHCSRSRPSPHAGPDPWVPVPRPVAWSARERGRTLGGTVETEAAILWERHSDWSVEPIELDPPKDGEVLIRLAASGMCHSDEHLVTGDLPVPLPVIGGHEGAGVVEEVGPGVTGLAPGDHVVLRVRPGLREVPVVRHGSLQPVRRRARRSWRGGRWTAPSATTPAGRTLDHGVPGNVRQVHRRQPGVLREDPRRHPARQGVPGRLRRHDRVGLVGVRRRRAARRQRRGHRHRRHRCVRAPGRPVWPEPR